MASEKDPVELVRAYFEHLENDEFEQAADLFTEDAVYHHPPSYGNETELVGRDTIYDFFANTRGPQDSQFDIMKEVSDGDRAAVLGSVDTGGDASPIFIGFAETENGKISFYAGAVIA